MERLPVETLGSTISIQQTVIEAYVEQGVEESIFDKVVLIFLKELKEYREIGTVEECRKARERQQEKKPIRLDLCTCPTCGCTQSDLRW